MFVRRAFIKAIAVASTAPALTRIAAAAPSLPAPDGRVILRVTGKIDVTNRDKAAAFDRGMLKSLPQKVIETYTDWTDGPQTFEGPLLSDLLERVGAHGDSLYATALNGYAATIPVSHAREHGVLLALRWNGEAMSVRRKGPIWIIYPNSDPDNSLPRRHNDKSVWQLSRIDVR